MGNFLFSNGIFSLLLLEIVGTKDYREPEWVTQMEEMQEALKGESNQKIV